MAYIPTPVTVVSGMTVDGPVAMVVGSFVSVSLDPPLIGFFVTHGSMSWPALQQAHRLGVSALASHHDDLARKLSRRAPDRFARAHWHYEEGMPPFIRDAVVTLTCRVESVTPAGDHRFVLCHVESLASDTSAPGMVFHDRAFAQPGPVTARRTPARVSYLTPLETTD
ncbi:flavin reductase family protein [Microbacterium sp. SSM24]|uniref:flavin reductase family protein n=1 Tax=Microbacterium sp. SSM24 TaxID=2991714 RepID=UPI00222710DE|nr:flavin reductase family protein [Microbacterium sp. SSM24]MCW3492617.1 flavin reductase family protein [Microbacterium sp. SSM24]